MKLYEVNAEIEKLVDESFDQETGEILMSDEEFESRMSALQIEKKRILVYLAKLKLNMDSDIKSLREEEKRLADRRHRLEGRSEKILQILDRECGEKTDLEVVTLMYRKTDRLEVDDGKAAYEWLKENKYEDCYIMPDPEIKKAEVKKLMKSGQKIPGTRLVEGNSCYLK